MGMLLALPVSGAERACKNNDECGRLEFEKADKQLTELMPQIFAFIDRFAIEQNRETAKSALAEAQRHWAAFRDAACKAEAATYYLRSARTTEGYTAQCLYLMTMARLEELKKGYLIGAGDSDKQKSDNRK
jgi:uncharacterized protein YecT (DUF1311 family)